MYDKNFLVTFLLLTTNNTAPYWKEDGEDDDSGRHKEENTVEKDWLVNGFKIVWGIGSTRKKIFVMHDLKITVFPPILYDLLKISICYSSGNKIFLEKMRSFRNC